MRFLNKPFLLGNAFLFVLGCTSQPNKTPSTSFVTNVITITNYVTNYITKYKTKTSYVVVYKTNYIVENTKSTIEFEEDVIDLSKDLSIQTSHSSSDEKNIIKEEESSDIKKENDSKNRNDENRTTSIASKDISSQTESIASPVSLNKEDVNDSKTHLSGVIFWVSYELSAIMKHNLKTGISTPFITKEITHPVDMAIDHKNKRLFWADFSERTIMSCNISKQQTTKLYKNREKIGGPIAVSYDNNNGLYFAVLGENGVKKINLTSQAITKIDIPEMVDREGLAVNGANGDIYYIPFRSKKIMKYTKNGILSLVYESKGEPKILRFNPINKNLYWLDKERVLIQSISTEKESSPEIITASQIVSPFGFSIDTETGNVFWSDQDSYSIKIYLAQTKTVSESKTAEMKNIKNIIFSP